MTSSPYQSNLLRFFVRQYQKGVNRHRSAMRKTRSSILLGGELGIVIAVAPVGVLLRTAQDVGKKAGRALEQAVDKLQLSASLLEVAKPTNLIDFSSFASLPIDKGDPEEDQDAEGGIDSSLVSADRIRHVGDDSASVRSEAVMAKALITVENKLSARQRRQLSGQLSWWQSFRVKTSGLVKRWLVRSHPPSSIASKHLSSKHGIVGEYLPSDKAQKITGLASDISTRSLVLVLGNITVWNGLSTRQQKYIQDRINTFIGVCDASPQVSLGDSQSQLVLGTAADTRSELSQTETAQIVAKASQALSVARNELVRPIRSFWIAVLQVMSDWFYQEENFVGSKRLMSGYLKLPALSSLLGRLVISLPGCSQYNLPSSYQYVLPIPQHKPNIQSALLRSTVGTKSSYLDATVISVDYIEHPLEQFLKWVDRCLVQIETWWQRFLDWREHWDEKGPKGK